MGAYIQILGKQRAKNICSINNPAYLWKHPSVSVNPASVKPVAVTLAIRLIWLSLAISMVLACISMGLKLINLSDLLMVVVMTLLMAIIPYKIAQKSNIARYVFVGLFVFSILGIVAMADQVTVTYLDKLELLINIPLNIYAIYFLFKNHEVMQWFG
ncbi:MAG: hypothetical protein EOO68_27235, partial [Moraxellaceae bacterium]